MLISPLSSPVSYGFFGLLSGLWLRWDGPLHFRLIVQPLVAIGLAWWDGRLDARRQRTAYLWAVFTGKPRQRLWLIKHAGRRIAKVLMFAFVLDGVYQLLAFQRVNLLDALLVALILGLLPYVLVRGPANRLSRYLRSRRP